MASSLNAGVVVMDDKFVAAAEPAKEKTLCESVFGLPTLYKDKDNPWIQEFKIIGRYHGQYWNLDSNQGNTDDWENRRARLGIAMKFLGNWDTAFQFNLDLDGTGDRFFQDIEDFYMRYKANNTLRFAVGKMKAPITHEWRTSSNSILAFERSAIINQAVPNKMGGLLTEITPGDWLFELGAYTNTVEDDWRAPDFGGGFSLFASVGFKAGFGTSRFEYLYSDIESTSAGRLNVTRGFGHIVSLNYSNKWDKFGFYGDAVYAAGDSGRSDIYGLILTPYYDITERLQVVFRCQIAGAEDKDGFNLQGRHEREAPGLAAPRGDFYQAVSLGLNYFICGNNLKLMTGIEYANADQSTGNSFNSWTYFAGVRVSF